MWFYVCVCPEIKLIKCVYLMKQLFAVFKSCIEFAQIIYLWGVDLIFSLQGLNKKGREFASGIMSGGKYVRILRMVSVFKPTTLRSARVHVCQEAQSLTECGQHGAVVEVSGTAQGSRQGERHCIIA